MLFDILCEYLKNIRKFTQTLFNRNTHQIFIPLAILVIYNPKETITTYFVIYHRQIVYTKGARVPQRSTLINTNCK